LRKLLIVAALGFVAASLAQAGDATATSETSVGKIEVSASTAPVAGKDGMFTFEATLKNTTTDTVIAAPRVDFLAGKPFNASSKGDDYDVSFAGTSNAAASVLTVDVKYSVKGEVVFAPRLVFRL
jgi:hypothetical protein